jgi:hypothetical protein
MSIITAYNAYANEIANIKTMTSSLEEEMWLIQQAKNRYEQESAGFISHVVWVIVSRVLAVTSLTFFIAPLVLCFPMLGLRGPAIISLCVLVLLAIFELRSKLTGLLSYDLDGPTLVISRT